MRAPAAVVLLSVAAVVGVSPASADFIDASDYDLTGLTGLWAWGQTAYNAGQTAGFVNNVTDRPTVEGLMSNGYAPSPQVTGPINGIFSNFDTTKSPLSLTFEFDGGADYLLSSLSFISSRSGSALTILMWDVRLDGGEWEQAKWTTSGSFPITTGAGVTYVLGLEAPVRADAFRFVIAPQVAAAVFGLHEIRVTGEAVIPEPATYALLGGLAGLALAWRRRR